jgi:hypothetical protein
LRPLYLPNGIQKLNTISCITLIQLINRHFRAVSHNPFDPMLPIIQTFLFCFLFCFLCYCSLVCFNDQIEHNCTVRGCFRPTSNHATRQTTSSRNLKEDNNRVPLHKIFAVDNNGQVTEHHHNAELKRARHEASIGFFMSFSSEIGDTHRSKQSNAERKHGQWGIRAKP